ncbi:MAG: DUF3822 family protein [Saprospiraceae bacterium]|nr:DUF3822 family protein [Saprospiraceae bacterium]
MIDISFKNKTGLKPEILSAVIGADSFFYGLFSEDYKLLECQYYPIQDFSDTKTIEKIKFDIFSVENLKIKITSTSKPYLHSDAANSGKLFQFFPSFLNKKTYENKFTDQDVVVDYGITKDQAQFLSTVLEGKSAHFHISTVLSNYYYPYSKSKLIAFIDESKLHILFGKDTNFVFYNQFHCAHENDYLYFIQLIYQELGLDLDSDPLMLSGRVDIDSPLYNLLYGYVRNIELLKSEQLHISDLRYRAKQHYYIDLFATALCE